MKQISNKEYERYRQYLTNQLHGRTLTSDGLRIICASFDYNIDCRVGHKYRNQKVARYDALATTVTSFYTALFHTFHQAISALESQPCLEKITSVSSRNDLENVLKSFFTAQNKIFPREIIPEQDRKINERRSG